MKYFLIFSCFLHWPITYLEVYYLISKYLSLLYVSYIRFLINAVVIREHNLKEFSLMKCIEIYFVGQHMFSSFKFPAGLFGDPCTIQGLIKNLGRIYKNVLYLSILWLPPFQDFLFTSQVLWQP